MKHQQIATHEHLSDDEEVVEASPRSFGFVFAVVFTIVALAPLRRGGPIRLWAAAVAAIFLIVALTRPAALGPLSRVWQRIGLLLHRVVNPIVLGVLFYLAITPFGLVMRLFRAGLRRSLSFDAAAPTYWVSRSGTPPSGMQNQF